MPTTESKSFYSTAKVAASAGVHRDTLLRWLREGKVPEPQRDARGWRIFTVLEAEAIARRLYGESLGAEDRMRESSSLLAVKRLEQLDWDFVTAKTDYLTHGLHPYPAKYIPQIPNALIQELSSVEETVADVFCGSGTTLVEALTLKRHAVGVDASPLACLISRAKTARLTALEVEGLRSLAEKASTFAGTLSDLGKGSLLDVGSYVSAAPRPSGDIDFWFDAFVAEELAEVLSWCRSQETEAARTVAYAAFSSIVVNVSKQDSDTRYVRRAKNVKAGDTLRKFACALESAIHGVMEFGELAEPRFRCTVINSSILGRPDIGLIDAMVCSPPYPNAWSYHLYHRTRMLWLGMDQPKFKAEEIGSHRKYSRKVPTHEKVDVFRNEMRTMFDWLRNCLRRGRYAAFVIGHSIIDGQLVNNADLLASIGEESGFKEVSRINRNIKATKKAFNPNIGKIRQEQILILQNRKGIHE